MIKLINSIVKESCDLKNTFTDEIDAAVNYCCIFSQSDNEFCELKRLANKIGKVVEETLSGPLYQIDPVETVSGLLKLLKIRNPDETKPERGDADFTVRNYHVFKDKYLSSSNFKLILKDDFEMIELMESGFTVRAYFSYPPLDDQFGLN
jgi:hypothetical protein